MNTKNNSRSLLTKNKIKNSMIQLLKEKDIDKISVKEICELSNINRSTFYMYYFDINDLLIKMEDEINEKLVRLLQMNKNDDQVGKKADLINYLMFLKENSEIFKICFKNKSINEYRNDVRRFLRNSVKYYLCRQAEDRSVNFECVLDFYESGLYSIIKRWALNDFSAPIEEITRTIDFCMKNKLEK